jgi:ATP-dependent Clp protease ATP-binding subunit ClpA
VSGVWDRLTPAARQVMRLAAEESEQLGHGYIGDEHVILGLLRGQAGRASSLLRRHGVDLAGARAELARLSARGLTPRSRTDDARALRAVGIDVEAVRERLAAAFGAEAVGAAVRQASRRRGGAAAAAAATRCVGPPLFAKRALWLAACYAEGQGEAAMAPEHLLYGVLRDLDDPYGAQLGRRGRKHLSQLGWTIGTINPAGALLSAHGIEPIQLRAELDHTP